jgi:hypothetical protein
VSLVTEEVAAAAAAVAIAVIPYCLARGFTEILRDSGGSRKLLSWLGQQLLRYIAGGLAQRLNFADRLSSLSEGAASQA